MFRNKLIALINWLESKDRDFPDGLKGLTAYRGLYSSLRYCLYLAVTRNRVASYSVSRSPRKSLHSPKFHWKNSLRIALLILMGVLVQQALVFFSAHNAALENTVGKTVIGLCWDVVWKWTSAEAFSFKETMKVVGTATGAAIGLYLLNKRTKAVDKQAQLAEKGLDIDRFREGSEMLAHEHPSVRQAGIESLKSLALSRHKEYGALVLDALSNFVKEPNATFTGHTVYWIEDRPDVHLAFMTVIQIWQNKSIRKQYLKKNRYLNMDRVRLAGGYYRSLDFQFVSFDKAEFIETFFIDTKFSFAVFNETDFRFCTFIGSSFISTNMYNPIFFGCDLSSVNWNGATLNKVQINDELDPSTVGDAYRVAWLSDMESTFGNMWIRSDEGSLLLEMSSATPLGYRIVEDRCGSLRRIRFVKYGDRNE